MAGRLFWLSAGILTIGGLTVTLQRYRRRRRQKLNAADEPTAFAGDEHSMTRPATYDASIDYSHYDILVLFPSTRTAEREKHYSVMSAEHLPGAEPTLLQPQDAQKKACTYGLDDSETELLASLKLLTPKSIQFLHVSLDSYTALFASWSDERQRSTLVLNLCDGTELDGIPGLSVLKLLESCGVAHTGADPNFYVVSTYKTRMKKLFDQRKVATSTWMMMEKEDIEEWRRWREAEKEEGNQESKGDTSATSSETADADGDGDDATAAMPAHALTSQPSPFMANFSPSLTAAYNRLSSFPYPLLVKPDDSYCSCGITTRSVVFTPQSAFDYAAEVAQQFSNIFVEQFVKGREFTVFIAGDARHTATEEDDLRQVTIADIEAQRSNSTATPCHASSASPSSSSSSSSPSSPLRVLSPVERAFDVSLPFWEQFISYELFWEIARRNPGKDEFIFQGVNKNEMTRQQDGTTITLAAALKQEALRAYIAVGGCGYARVDMRYDPASHRIAVLEVNANCGITQYRQTAMGEILRESNVGFHEVLDGFFNDAIKARDARTTKGDTEAGTEAEAEAASNRAQSE